jgi:hypothetical protein
MTSAPVRDPLADHLITPDNAALLLIDYQPAQLVGLPRPAMRLHPAPSVAALKRHGALRCKT